MTNGFPMVLLREALRLVSRPEPVDPGKTYRILGAHWYAKGLYVKDIKPGSEIQADKVYRVEKGDFVYNRLFAWKGSFAVATEENHGCYVSNEFPCFAVNGDRADAHYLWRYFSRTSAWEEALGLSTGGTPTSRNRLKEDRLLAMRVPLPPLSEQRRIVARIEKLAARIKEARGLRQDSVEAAKKLWAAGAAQLLHAMPAAKWRRLGDLVLVHGGGTPSKTNPAFWNGTVPWVCPRDMKQREIYDSIDHITESAIDDSSAKLISPEAVLVVVRGMILAHTFPTAVLRVPATINQDMKALIPKDGLLPKYVCAVLWGLNSDILTLVERSGHDTRRLVTEKLKDFLLPVPPVDEQPKVLAQLDRLQTRVETLNRLQAETVVELDAMLPSIVDKAFRGDL